MPLVKRPLTPEEAEWYAQQGYDPSKITAEVEVPDKPTSATAAAARGAGAAALPTAAGGAAAGLTMAGLPALLAGLGFAPLTGGSSLLIPAAGLIAGAGVGMGAAKAQEAVMPEEWKEQLAKDIEEHPVASRVGQVAALPLGGFNPGKDVFKAGAYGVNRLLGLPTTREGAQAVINTGIGTGIGLVQEGAMQAFHDDLDPARLAESALIGSVFTARNRLGEAYKFPAPSQRAVDAGNPAFKIGKKQVVSAEQEKVAPVTPPVGPVVPTGAAVQPSLNFEGLMAQPELPLQTPTTPVIKKPVRPDTLRTPSVVQLEQSLKKSGYTGEITPVVLKGWQEVMAEHGITSETGEIPGARGEYTPETATTPAKIKVTTEKADVSTAPHELSHHIWISTPENIRTKYVEKVKADVERINSERETWNKSNPDEKMRPIDPEEYFASEMGVKAALRASAGENVGLKNWWQDTKAGLTARYGDPTVGDIYRTELVRLMNGQKPLSFEVKGPVQAAEKKQPDVEGVMLGEGSELDYSQIKDTKQQGRLEEKVRYRAKQAAEKEALGLTGQRSAGVKPASYPQDEQYTPVPKAPERRHPLGEPTPGEVELIDKTLNNAFNYHFNRLKGRSSLYDLPKETIQDIKGRAIEKLMAEGVDSSEAGGLRNTIFRRMNDAINDEIADFKKNRQKQVSLQKPIGKTGETELGDIVAKQPEKVTEEVMAKEEGTLDEDYLPVETEAPKEEVPVEEIESTEVVTRQPKVKETAEAPAKVERALSDVIARLEQVRKELVAQGKPVQNAKKIEAIDNAIDMIKNLPPDEPFDIGKIMKGKFQGELEGIELPEGYRKVNLVKPDGTKEEVLFNDKYYENLPGGRRASIARMKEGKMSHGIARKDETIEEISGTKQQTEDESIFVPKSLDIAQKPPLGLTNASGAFNGSTLINYFRNKLTPVEFDLLQKAGIEKEFGGRLVKKEEVANWIKKNLPEVKVYVYGMEGKVSESQRKGEAAAHELDTLGYIPQLNNQGRVAILRNRNGEEVVRISKETGEIVEGKASKQAVKYLRDWVKASKEYEAGDINLRATSAYNTVSALPTNEPMPEWTTSKEGRNVQRVDVVIPTKPAKNYEYGKTTLKGEEPLLWQPDHLHENLPNTLGWAMIQYKTVGDKKVAFVGEVQSRWGQERREAVSKAKELYPEAKTEQERQAQMGTRYYPQDHPLLRDYNRLILKAAINQAKKEGATYIVVSDAESAMMSEGHDLLRESYNITLDTEKRANEIAQEYKDKRYNDIRIVPHETGVGRKWTVYASQAINQEPGMRLNYDTVLPKIMEELTGQKGEKVSLGKHKNAFEKDTTSLDITAEQRAAAGPAQLFPRSNLIFRNPDGTPKTDVTGTIFPLEQVSKRLDSGEKFSTFNKFQTEDESIDTGRQGFFKSWAGTFDKLKKVEPKLTDAFNRWETQKDIYEGWGNAAAKDLQKYSRDEVNEVFAAHREAFRNKTDLPEFDGKKAEISDILTDYFHDSIGEERRDIDLEINERTPGLNPAYVPDMLSAKAVDLLVNKPYLPEGKAAAREWAEYIVEASEGKITLPEAKEYVQHYTRAMGATSGNYLSVDYGPIRKAEGFGVPESLREKDALTALLRYSRRAARDLAMFKELEKPRDIAAMLELNDRVSGKTITHEGVEGISKLQEVKNAMKWVTGEFSSAQANLQTPKFTAIVRLVNNLIMGPATGLRDTATVPVNMVPYINSFSDLGAALTGITKFRENARAALEYGATKPNIDKIQFQDLAESPDRFTDITRKLATWARLGQGREHIENFNRDVTFSIGKELAKVNILGARAGRRSSQQFLEKFGTLVDGDITTMEGEALDTAINTIAKNFTDRNQGTYGGRGLPVGIVDSQFAPFFSLQKWSLEKSNIIWKDVFKPFISGENRLPMLTYLLGSVMTGAAIQELNKLLTGKKSQDPEVKEVLAKGSTEDYIAKLVSLMQLGSYAGIMSDISKGATDALTYGKAPRNIASFPTASLALDMQERIAFVAEAVNSGENPIDVAYNFALDVFSQNIQLARMISNRTLREERIERSEKFRDLRVFNQLEGKNAERFPPVNPYLGLDTREFKRTSDLGEARELAKDIKKEAKEESSSRYEYKRALRGAKTMSYRTVPSRETDPVGYRRYYKYLVETQGKERADEIIRDNRRQRRLNKRKAAMLP